VKSVPHPNVIAGRHGRIHHTIGPPAHRTEPARIPLRGYPRDLWHAHQL